MVQLDPGDGGRSHPKTSAEAMEVLGGHELRQVHHSTRGLRTMHQRYRGVF